MIKGNTIMKKLIKYLPLLLIVLLVFSCAKDEPTLDCSSPETFGDSFEKMTVYIIEEKSGQNIDGFLIGLRKITLELDSSQDDIETLKKFDGWTISQIIDHGK